MIASFLRVVGRVAIGLFFMASALYSFFFNWDKTLVFTKTHFPMISDPSSATLAVLVLIAICSLFFICEIFPKTCAFILALLLGTVTCFVNNFWAAEQTLIRNEVALEFLQNMAIVGGLLFAMTTESAPSKPKKKEE